MAMEDESDLHRIDYSCKNGTGLICIHRGGAYTDLFLFGFFQNCFLDHDIFRQNDERLTQVRKAFSI